MQRNTPFTCPARGKIGVFFFMSKGVGNSLKIDLLNGQTRANVTRMRYTFKDFREEYPDDDACLDALFRMRFGKLACCPFCGVVKAEFIRVKGRKCYSCVHCRSQLFPMAGTIFQKSTTSLWSWFYAIYLFSVSRNGVAANELERQLGICHETAWRMANRIRSAMSQGDTQLFGVVEADEAFIGGRRRSSNRYSNKTPLLGVVERKGRARVVVTDHASATTAIPFLKANVAKGTILHTDESGIYNRAHQTFEHHKVKHSDHEYVRGDDYTNTIEGFWGLFKPSLNGTHRSVSKKWLQLYVNEAVWKYNHRGQPLYPLLIEAVAQPVSGSR